MISATIPQINKKRIVIIGGGFAGFTLAKKLAKSDLYQIVLIDKHNYHQFQPLLYQVAISTIAPNAVCFPFRRTFQRKKDFHFRLASMEYVDTVKKKIETDQGNLNYDILVFAMGTTTNFFGMKGLENLVMPMKSIADAIQIRNQILINLESAISTTNNVRRNALMTVVVVGGGPTGVEISGALSEMRKVIFPKDYPELDFSKMRIILIEGEEKVLGNMSKFSSFHAANYLKKLGIELLTGTSLDNYNGDEVILSNGQHILTKNVIWTAGVKSIQIQGLEDALRQHGRYEVDEFNQLKNYKDIFVVGDQSYMKVDKYPKGHPQLATVALEQGRTLANNLLKGLNKSNYKPFVFKNKGVMATIGKNKAVADLPVFSFKGYFAWLLWMSIHLIQLVGWRNKIVTLVNWGYKYLTLDQSIRLILKLRDKGKKK